MQFYEYQSIKKFQILSILPKEGLYLSLNYTILSGTTEVCYLVVQKGN